MHTWFPYVRIVHIVCGMIALFVAPAAMLTAKEAERTGVGEDLFLDDGDNGHDSDGHGSLSSIVFLALVAIFSFYFAFRGYRSILRKNQRAEVMIGWPPWSLWQEVLAWSLWGFIRLPRQFFPAPTVSITFGLFGIGISGIDIWRFVRPSSDLNTWWYSHMGGMLGSYIATVSAFSAVNFHFLPVVIRWLWPSPSAFQEFFCGSRITGKDSVVAQTKMPRHRL